MSLDYDFPPEDEPRPITRPARTPDRTPPHSAEAEEHVIACCLLDGGDLGPTNDLTWPSLSRAADALTPESFYLPANRVLFSTLLDLRAAGQPVTPETVAEQLKSTRQLEAVGGFPYLMRVTGAAPTTAHATFFISKLRELHALRETIQAATRTVEEAYGYTGGLDEFLQSAEARISSIRTGNQQEKKATALAELLARRVLASAPPPEPVTRLFLADKPIATGGNLQTITAKSKTGKTVATGAAVAAIICATTSTLDRDTFKFRASNPAGHAVVVIDTEQSPFDAYTCYQRILKRAGTEEDPPWLLHFALVGYSVARRKQALSLILEHAKAKFGGIFLVILDGVAHFVSSINEIIECNAMADWLRELSVQYDTAILCVIHSNEGEKAGDDSRGHLGKQLMRDAESNLLLKKDGEVTTITSDKQRKAPITESDGVAFRWSDDQQMHISTTAQPKAKGGKPRKHFIQDYFEVLPKPGSQPKTAAQIYRMANDLRSIPLQSFKDLLAEAAKDGLVRRTFGGEAVGFLYALEGPPPPKPRKDLDA